ncbi:MAG: hypothetical protein WAW37_18110, partial [Syntrophobacteraceae bacterium]
RKLDVWFSKMVFTETASWSRNCDSLVSLLRSARITLSVPPAVGPNQVAGRIGALGIIPPNDSVAINPESFGLPYDTYEERVATQIEIRNNIGNVRVHAPDLYEHATGGTTFTIGDVGDANIRNSLTTRMDIYRFATQQDALSFGRVTVPVTITGVPNNWSCPE